ncbi:MAG: leucine-rich repeat protein, partial [Bacteroidales bacterium]|nr:leucine-rich repeat protein [Bacteroidales bacterium]
TSYILKDEDVEVVDCMIVSCSYDFSIKNIIIPDELDGQVIKGIAGEKMLSTSGVFSNKSIKSIQLPKNIEYIGNYALYGNKLLEIDFSSYDKLKRIGDRAFANNLLKDIDLSSNTGLLSIDKGAFSGNSFNKFILPTNQEDKKWKTYVNNEIITLNGGDEITDLYNYYAIPVEYELKDEDVEMEFGVILSCQNVNLFSNLVIPEMLKGQTVTGILGSEKPENAVFGSKHIMSISLPITLEYIGDYAFSYNHLSEINLGGYNKLREIGVGAFMVNSIKDLNLSNNTSLKVIDDNAFRYNDLNNIDLFGTTNINEIGDFSFDQCSIAEWDLSGFDSLYLIGRQAFGRSVPITHLPENLMYPGIEWIDSKGTTYSHEESVICDYHRSYYLPRTYEIKSEDVIVMDGIIVSCSYDFAYETIIIPEILDNQTVIGIADSESENDGVFSGKKLSGICFPSTIEFIGDYAFSESTLINVDFESSTSLERIGRYAFYDNNILTLDFTGCSSLKSVESCAFESNEITNIDLSRSTSLRYIGNGSFSHNDMQDIDLSACVSLELIEKSAFFCNRISEFALPRPNIPGYKFEYWLNNDGSILSNGQSVSSRSFSYKAIVSALGYPVYFLVSDDLNKIDHAIVDLEGYGKQCTDDNNVATFYSVLPSNSIRFNVSALGYCDIKNTFELTTEMKEIPVVFGITTDVETFGDNILDENIYYNPLEDKLIIKDHLGCDMILYDITGKLIKKRHLNSNDFQMECNNLPNGIYILKVGTSVKKILLW